jgi:hypothetical protein
METTTASPGTVNFPQHPIGMDSLLVIDPNQETGSRNGTRGFAVQNPDGDRLACLRVPRLSEECRAERGHAQHEQGHTLSRSLHLCL